MSALLALLAPPTPAGEPPPEAAEPAPEAAEPAPEGDRTLAHLARRAGRLGERAAEQRERLAAVDGKAEGRVEERLIRAIARQTGFSRQVDAWDRVGREVPVFYATNRQRTAGRRGEVDYGSVDAGRVEYGIATVSIPDRHPSGAIEADLEIVAVEPLTPDAFRIKLFEAVAAEGPRGEVVTWVHGYNTSFPYAARRAAQVVYDLERPVVPVLFSWPSHGDTSFAALKYTYDENAAARSSAGLATVLDELLDATGDAPISVVAHSMGSRVVSEALLDLRYAGRQGRRLDHLVLAAPDLDAGVFEARYLHPATDAARHVTVYCATDDRALQLSRSVHGGYDRLGSCRDHTIGWLSQAGVDVVDASKLHVDVVGHDKLADSPRLLRDLRATLDEVPAADPRRGLERDGAVWRLPP